MRKTIKILFFLVCITSLLSCTIRSKKGLVISRLQKASKLATTEVIVTKNVYYKKDAKGIKSLLFKDRFFLARTEAVVKLGIDLKEIKGDDIIIRNDEISLKLPPVQVINFSYPAERFFIDTIITDYGEGTGNRLTIDEIDAVYREAETQIKKTLSYMHLEKSAQEKTRMVVEELCKNIGFRIITIEFDSAHVKLFEEI